MVFLNARTTYGLKGMCSLCATITYGIRGITINTLFPLIVYARTTWYDLDLLGFLEAFSMTHPCNVSG